jgi:hypothetical protein
MVIILSRSTRGAPLFGLGMAVSEAFLLVSRAETCFSQQEKFKMTLDGAQCRCVCTTHLSGRKSELLQGMATVASERVADAGLNSSRSLVHGRGLQDTLEGGPPTFPVPSHRRRLLAACWHQAHLTLRREQGGWVQEDGQYCKKLVKFLDRSSDLVGSKNEVHLCWFGAIVTKEEEASAGCVLN